MSDVLESSLNNSKKLSKQKIETRIIEVSKSSETACRFFYATHLKCEESEIYKNKNKASNQQKKLCF